MQDFYLIGHGEERMGPILDDLITIYSTAQYGSTWLHADYCDYEIMCWKEKQRIIGRPGESPGQ